MNGIPFMHALSSINDISPQLLVADWMDSEASSQQQYYHAC
jgi:hypothetical protein